MRILVICALLAGILWVAIQREWVLINYPPSYQPSDALTVERRSASLWYWKHDQWHHENIELISATDKATVLKQIIDQWLILLQEEHLLEQKVTAQAVILLPNEQDACISFDKNLFKPEQVTHEKWMLVEGLLKTIRENNISIQTVRLLKQHNELVDEHLDFSNPWPVIGFSAV